MGIRTSLGTKFTPETTSLEDFLPIPFFFVVPFCSLYYLEPFYCIQWLRMGTGTIRFGYLISCGFEWWIIRITGDQLQVSGSAVL